MYFFVTFMYILDPVADAYSLRSGLWCFINSSPSGKLLDVFAVSSTLCTSCSRRRALYDFSFRFLLSLLSNGALQDLVNKDAAERKKGVPWIQSCSVWGATKQKKPILCTLELSGCSLSIVSKTLSTKAPGGQRTLPYHLRPILCSFASRRCHSQRALSFCFQWRNVVSRTRFWSTCFFVCCVQARSDWDRTAFGCRALIALLMVTTVPGNKQSHMLWNWMKHHYSCHVYIFQPCQYCAQLMFKIALDETNAKIACLFLHYAQCSLSCLLSLPWG